MEERYNRTTQEVKIERGKHGISMAILQVGAYIKAESCVVNKLCVSEELFLEMYWHRF